jgi:steroid 5-alpha reductase family enzyme
MVAGTTLLAVFTITWLIQLQTKNAAIVDAVWSVSFPLMALIYFLRAPQQTIRQWLVLTLVVLWGLRLGIHLLIRTLDHKEDVRYTALREEWGDKQNILMLRFYYFQAILALILSLPFALIMLNGSSSLTMIEWVGVIVWVVAFIGESTADQQLKKFKSDPSNKGKVCNVGLWYYSRHPNYFFEWLIWISYFIIALSAQWGFVTIICPLFMLYFLLKVTGIPYTESQMVKSKGQPFIEYQRTTSAFIPLPKRKR